MCVALRITLLVRSLLQSYDVRQELALVPFVSRPLTGGVHLDITSVRSGYHNDVCRPARATHEVNSCHVLVYSDLVLPTEIVKVPRQAGHDLPETRIRLRSGL